MILSECLLTYAASLFKVLHCLTHCWDKFLILLYKVLCDLACPTSLAMSIDITPHIALSSHNSFSTLNGPSALTSRRCPHQPLCLIWYSWSILECQMKCPPCSLWSWHPHNTVCPLCQTVHPREKGLCLPCYCCISNTWHSAWHEVSVTTWQLHE